MMPTSAEYLRHQRLVHAANTLAIARHPNTVQITRLAELWRQAGEAVIQ